CDRDAARVAEAREEAARASAGLVVAAGVLEQFVAAEAIAQAAIRGAAVVPGAGIAPRVVAIEADVAAAPGRGACRYHGAAATVERVVARDGQRAVEDGGAAIELAAATDRGRARDGERATAGHEAAILHEGGGRQRAVDLG